MGLPSLAGRDWHTTMCTSPLGDERQREALANHLRLHISEAILDLSGLGELAQTIRTTESTHSIMKKDKYLLFKLS